MSDVFRLAERQQQAGHAAGFPHAGNGQLALTRNQININCFSDGVSFGGFPAFKFPD
jgi:hypothetical protein